MRLRYFYITIFLFLFIGLQAQEERRFVRKGNKLMEKESYSEAAEQYKKALKEEPTSFEAGYNLASALYRQEKYEEAFKQLKGIESFSDDNEKLAKMYHNIGNNLLHTQQIDPAIEAFKSSLKANPLDDQTRYNLIAAMKMKDEQEQNQENQEEKQEEQEQEQEEQDQDQDQDQQQNQEEQQREQEREREQQEQDELDKENAERLLEAIEQDERELMERLQKEKHKEQRPVKIEKNW